MLLGAVLFLGVLWFLARTFRRWFGEARDALSLRKAASTPPREPTDPRQLFTDGAQLGSSRIRIERITTLHVPTGKIVACDPLVFADDPPFDRCVAPGDYAVDAAVAQLPDQQRVAAIRIQLAEGTPVKFESAGTYGVDAGLGCFMDEQTAKLLVERMSKDIDGDGNYFDDVLAKEIGDSDWVDHRPVKARSENVAIAHSGWGDGIYESYWGLDDAGNAVWLVTDFAVA